MAISPLPRDAGGVGIEGLRPARQRYSHHTGPVTRNTVQVQPETQYAMSGDVHIAYQVVGEGQLDLVWIPSLAHRVGAELGIPSIVTLPPSELMELGRLLLFDKRGTGMSDRISSDTTLETRMDDIRAVMDAAGSDPAIVHALGEGGPLAMLFAATYPERTDGLVLINSSPRLVRSAEFPWFPFARRAGADHREDGA